MTLNMLGKENNPFVNITSHRSVRSYTRRDAMYGVAGSVHRKYYGQFKIDLRGTGLAVSRKVCPSPLLFFFAFGYDHLFSNLDFLLWSSAAPQSLVLRVVGSRQRCCRLFMNLGQVCRLWPGVWSLSPQTAGGWCPRFLGCWWNLQCPVYGVGILRLGLYSPVDGCCLSLVSIDLSGECLPLPGDPLFHCLVYSRMGRDHLQARLLSWLKRPA
jgi:hypothetical protein